MDRRVKIDDIEKEYIRRRYRAGGVTCKQLAKEYGVCFQTISIICNEKSRARLKDYMDREWARFPSNSKENQHKKYLKYKEERKDNNNEH